VELFLESIIVNLWNFSIELSPLLSFRRGDSD
jgi:hypothetical protein